MRRYDKTLSEHKAMLDEALTCNREKERYQKPAYQHNETQGKVIFNVHKKRFLS
jgi:hypothetical protein